LLHGRGKRKRILAEGRGRRGAAGLCDDRRDAHHPDVGQRRSSERDQQGQRCLARTAVGRRRALGLVGASGIFTGSVAEGRIRANALAGAIDDYELSFESGEKMRGRFLVTRLDYAGDYNGERTYALSLESSGEVAAA
jgi:hypothetical protein